MTQEPHDQPSQQQAGQPSVEPGAGEDRTEPSQSPQRRLVESLQAFEVDPPAPARASADDGQPA